MVRSPRGPWVVAVASLSLACAQPLGEDGGTGDGGGERDVPVVIDVTDVTGEGGLDAVSSCASDRDCTDPSRAVCDLASGRCVQCRAASDRCPEGTWCDARAQACVPGCSNDDECERRAGDAGVPDGFTGGADAMAPVVPQRRCDPITRACVSCLGDPDCPSGTVCVDRACRPGCNTSHPCPAGGTCCAGVCADLQSDGRHCGACGTACEGATDACCAGRCQDTRGSVEHCGGCGVPCAPSHALPRCAAGVCSVERCQPGFEDLDGNPRNGCECESGNGGAACASAAMVPLVASGMSADVTGVVAGSTTEQWFRTGFAAMTGTLHITFAANPDGAYRFDVMASCGGAALTCSNRGAGAAGLDDWSFFDTPGAHNSRNVPWPSAIFVRVYRTTPSLSCERYVLRLSN